jgi:hypothetical protein
MSAYQQSGQGFKQAFTDFGQGLKQTFSAENVNSTFSNLGDKTLNSTFVTSYAQGNDNVLNSVISNPTFTSQSPDVLRETYHQAIVHMLNAYHPRKDMVWYSNRLSMITRTGFNLNWYQDILGNVLATNNQELLNIFRQQGLRY